MIWQKMKKIIRPATARIKPEQAWVDFGNLMGRMVALQRYQARTEDPQGKVGVVELNHSFGPKFIFRKFGKKAFENAEGFIKALERRGFKALGSGAFATVLAKEGQKRVIKVIRRPDGWINYIHWAAQAGEAGHFAPRVFSYKKIKGRKKDFAVAVVERLSYTLEDAPEEHALKIIPSLIWHADNPMARKFMEMLAPGLMDYLAKMAAEWKIKLSNFDLHNGNLMLREDGSFVIVDPVNRGEDKYNRLRVGDLLPLPLIIIVKVSIARSRRYRSEWVDKPYKNLGCCLQGHRLR
jgi:hypothetical protein